MNSLNILLVVSLQLYFSIIVAENIINQHTCKFEEKSKTLICSYTGQGNYVTDRQIDQVEIVRFHFFGKGLIQIKSSHLPALKQVEVMKALTSVNEVCMSVHADAPVKVEDNFCETIKDSPTSISFQDYPSTISNEHAKSTQSKLSVTIEMRKEDNATEQTREAPIGKTQTLTIIITALSVILLVILLSWVKARISRMLEQRTQRKLMRPTFPGLSFSERMRARRGGRSRNADSEV